MEYAASAPDRSRAIAKALLRWYAENARDLPWRRTKESYAVWISEIMAQQTRIAALLPYYERFMRRFPSVRILAAADIEDVLKAWEGLGYYSRAHNLHRAAREVVERYGGELPSNPNDLKSLPGIGEYTAGAISSIAFDQRVPAIDGNVLRIFSRMEASGMNVSLPSTKAALSAYLSEMFPTAPGEASAFAQATMELGALVCLPGKPLCEDCPVRLLCKAFSLGTQSMFPVKSPKKTQRVLDKTVLIVADETGSILMRRRTERLLHGLWEFCICDAAMDGKAAREFLASVGFLRAEVEPLGEARHVFTHVIWNMTGFLCRVRAGDGRPPEGYRWIPRAQQDEVAMPSALGFYRKQISPWSRKKDA